MDGNINKNLYENIERFEQLFEGCGDIVSRKIPVGWGRQYETYITYIDGLVNREFIEKQLVTNLVVMLRDNPPSCHFGDIKDAVVNSGVAMADISEVATIKEAALQMLSGDCVLIIDGCDTAIILSSKGWPNRGIGQPDTEMVLQGSKEAFTETMRMNTALIRRRIRDVNLKIKQIKVGRRSNTDIAVVYLKDVVRNNILNDVLSKIEKIDIDAIAESGYVAGFFEDKPFSPYPQTQMTERPDVVAAAILEGRIAVIVDNTPFVIIIPVTINTFFQSPEDYYQRFEIMSAMRLIRYISAIISVCAPAIYIAVTVYHPSMIPASILLKMAAARESVPFPAVFEIIIMEVVFELLREAGIRLPGLIGGTLGIVGGLIMGQAAVEAGIVSPIVVIVVALAGTASFTLPHQSMVAALRLVKFYFIVFAASLGLLGFWIAMLSMLIHIASIKSFGIPYLYPLGCSDLDNRGDLKDTLYRAPLSKMVMRPIFANPKQKQRMNR